MPVTHHGLSSAVIILLLVCLWLAQWVLVDLVKVLRIPVPSYDMTLLDHRTLSGHITLSDYMKLSSHITLSDDINLSGHITGLCFWPKAQSHASAFLLYRPQSIVLQYKYISLSFQCTLYNKSDIDKIKHTDLNYHTSIKLQSPLQLVNKLAFSLASFHKSSLLQMLANITTMCNIQRLL